MEDEIVTQRNQQMATILDFESNPSRKALLQDILSRGLLQDVLPELKHLYELLDTKFHPLTMTKSLTNIIQFVKNHPSLNVYAIPLQRVIVLRVMQQLSKVYSVIKIEFLKTLFVGLTDLTFIDAEKIMIDGVMRRELQLSIDHINKAVKFVVAPTLSSIENQITQFSKDLFQIKHVIQNKDIANGNTHVLETIEKSKKERQQLFEKIKNSSDLLHTQLLARKNIIEKRKVDIERAQEEREKVHQIILDREGARRQAEEEQRLELEKQKREDEKKKKMQEK
jgi:translation initiation factor 3 subunit A